MVQSFFNESIIKRAIEKGAVEIEIVNLRDFALDSYGTVDDRPYGGGAGMVLRVDVVAKAIEKVTSPVILSEAKNLPAENMDPSPAKRDQDDKVKILLTSAKGQPYNQKKAQELSKLDHVVIIAGHYEGFDERILDHIDEEVSLGDFVMTGGEIAVAAITDSIVRLLPGVLKKDDATEQESFFEVDIDTMISAVGETELLKKLKDRGIKSAQLLEYPHYTRPSDYEGSKVPEVLLEGNHAKIVQWKILQAYRETCEKRPDLLDKGEK